MAVQTKSAYAHVNGLDLYYEIHGGGAPLVLLHGGAIGISMFGPTVPALAAHRQVIAPELQGHGHTPDIDRPLSFEGMADDVGALIAELGIGAVDVMGYSLGAGTALQVAFRHPESVRRLVVVSQPFRHDGWYPEVLANFAQMGPAAGEPLKDSPLAKLYPKVDWGRLFGKLGTLLRADYDWSEQVKSLTAPTMLVFADADAVRPEHIVEFYGLLGGGRRDAGLDGSGRPITQLAILPGLTHYTVGASPALPPAVLPFLEAPVAQQT